MGYSYITFGTLKAQLLARLQDSAGVFTLNGEAGTYIVEALRVLNAKTFAWNADIEFTFQPGDQWRTLVFTGSRRNRTVHDTDIYNQMEVMLLEPITGGTWTGTSQYNIGILSAALQYRRDELLLQSAANPVQLLQNSPVNSTRSTLPDTALDLMRVRSIPQDGSMPYVLGRDDVSTANAFGPLLNIKPGPPDSWMITAAPPLAFDVTSPPNQPGTFDLIYASSGAVFAPPTSNVLGIPDDWAWVAMYGALADVLSNAPEGRDLLRAKYCLKRYEEGRKAMTKIPWLLEAKIGNIPVDTPSLDEMDAWMQNWEQRQSAGDPQIVVGGTDFIALAPFIPTAGAPVDTLITVVGNAPVPVLDTDQVQLSRDGVDAVLDYAQHLAAFKMGGDDFMQTMPLLDQFEAYCRTKNAQYAALSTYRYQLLSQGYRSDDFDPRFQKEPV